jgi:hypothetical protein
VHTDLKQIITKRLQERGPPNGWVDICASLSIALGDKYRNMQRVVQILRIKRIDCEDAIVAQVSPSSDFIRRNRPNQLGRDSGSIICTGRRSSQGLWPRHELRLKRAQTSEHVRWKRAIDNAVGLKVAGESSGGWLVAAQ